MERIPNLQVIGQADPKDKEQTKDFFSARFFEHNTSLSDKDLEIIKKNELTKTPEALNFISFANKETNRLRQQFGLDGYNVSAENYHFLPREVCQRLNMTAAAVTYNLKQGIIIQNDKFRDSKLSLAAVIFHETMHLKAFTALQSDQGVKEFDLFRSGVSAHSRTGHEMPRHVHFKGFHEAIVSEQEIRTLDKIILLPNLREECLFLEMPMVKEQIAKFKKQNNINSDSFVWFNIQQNRLEVVETYSRHRKLLKYVCQEIQQEFSDQYANFDAIFAEFLRAHFAGSLLTIGKLVEKTFGPGSFRSLGNVSEDENSVNLCFEDLSRRRRKQLVAIDHQ